MVKLKVLALASMLFTGVVMAAPNVNLSNTGETIPGGASVLSMTFQSDSSVAGLDFTYSFDAGNFTPTISCLPSVPTSGADATVACAVVGNTIKVLVSAPFAFPVPTIVSGDLDLGTVNFQSNADTALGKYDFLFVEENYFDINANAVASTPSQDGAIFVTDPVPLGDANADGVVNEADIAAVVDQYFGVANAPGKPDCNQDGDVNSGDIICITNVALGG